MKGLFTLLTLMLVLSPDRLMALGGFQSVGFVAKLRQAGGTPQWYDVGTLAEGDTESSQNTGTMNWGSFVSIGQSGNCTKLRIYIHSGGTGDNFKMALYPAAGGNPVTSGTAAVASVPAFLEVTVTPAHVDVTTYIIAWEDDAVAGPAAWYKTGTGTFDFATQLYSGFPPSPLPASAATFARKYAVSAYVEP